MTNNIDSYAGAILAIASFGILAVWALGLCRCGNDQHRSLPGNLAPDRDRAGFDAELEAQRTPGMGWIPSSLPSAYPLDDEPLRADVYDQLAAERPDVAARIEALALEDEDEL